MIDGFIECKNKFFTIRGQAVRTDILKGAL